MIQLLHIQALSIRVGLGRYGDVLNSDGDLETIKYIHDHLKPNGLCFLGLPVGKDSLVWNAHRIYGEIRLKLLISENFIEMDWFGFDKKSIYYIKEKS